MVAKPLAGGLPLGAIPGAGGISPQSFSPGLHGSTFGGGPLTCATALEFLDTVEDRSICWPTCARAARELRAGLNKLAAKFDFIREVRGEGLMLGIDLDVEGAPYVAEALKQGLLINCTHDHILRLLPPFILTRAAGEGRSLENRIGPCQDRAARQVGGRTLCPSREL